MIKIHLLFLALVGFATCSAPSAKVINESPATNPTVKTNEKKEVTEKEKISNDRVENKERVDPTIFLGLINLENGKANTFESQVWSLTKDENQYQNGETIFEVDKGKIIDVDILNCAGYLGSAKATYDSGDGIYWKIKFIPETLAADSAEKVKQCDADQKDDYVESKAFAVAPRNNKRQNIKIGQVDTRKLFTSLPKEIQKSLNNKYNAEKREKKNLSLIYDNWTDLDGDGQIDLIVASIPNEKQTEEIILLLVEGKWKKIGEIQPA